MSGILIVTVFILCSLLCVEGHEDRVCDFPIIDGSDLNPNDFDRHFMEPNRPVLIQNAAQNWACYDLWNFSKLAETFGTEKLRVGPGPYPDREITMAEYLKEAETLYKKRQVDSSTYIPGVFQYGQVPTSWTLWSYKETCIPNIAFTHTNSRPLHNNLTWVCEKIMKNIRVPKFLVGEADEIPACQITHSGFLVGYPGSGIDYHRHQDAINIIVEGKKQWYMKVPNKIVDSFKSMGLDSHSSSDWNPSCKYLEDSVCKAGKDSKLGRKTETLGVLANELNAKEVTEEEEEDASVLSCVQYPGEIVYIPADMQHGVINLEPTVAMQMQWNRDDWNQETARAIYKSYLLHALDPNEPDPTVKIMAPGAAEIINERHTEL